MFPTYPHNCLSPLLSSPHTNTTLFLSPSLSVTLDHTHQWYLIVVAWREPAVPNVIVINEAHNGGLERASRDQHGRDQRGRWPLKRVNCYEVIPLQDIRLVPH
ncbi:hypothetical protein Hanom_Chr13g01242231 [Helianthus anomalus]